MEQQGDIFLCTVCVAWPRVTHPEVAFTPLHGYAWNGAELNYVMLLRSAYASGNKCPNDNALHMICRETDTIPYCDKMITKFYKYLEIALAFTEVMRTTTTKFEKDIVEPDSARTGARRN